MFRLFSITLLLLLPVQNIASVSYKVNIAVFQNADSLKQQLNTLAPALRKNIKIQKKGKLYIAASAPTKDKETLQTLLPAYNKVFPDAFISVYRPFKERPIQESPVKTEEVLPQTVQEPETDTMTPSRIIVNPPMENMPLLERLQGKTLYLGAYGVEIWSPNILIQIDFLETEVNYTSIMGEVSAKKESYKIENEKLYISQKGLFDPEIYSTLEEVSSEYYLISSWVGEKKINTLRYYFDLENAKAYVVTLK